MDFKYKGNNNIIPEHLYLPRKSVAPGGTQTHTSCNLGEHPAK